MKGSKKRARATAQTFEKLIEATAKASSLDDNTLLSLSDHIRGNHKLSLEELKVSQQIEESQQRLATDEAMLKMLQEEVITGNYVRASEERERVLGILQGLKHIFAEQLADLLYPVPSNTEYVNDVLAAIQRKQHGAK